LGFSHLAFGAALCRAFHLQKRRRGLGVVFRGKGSFAFAQDDSFVEGWRRNDPQLAETIASSSARFHSLKFCPVPRHHVLGLGEMRGIRFYFEAMPYGSTGETSCGKALRLPVEVVSLKVETELIPVSETIIQKSPATSPSERMVAATGKEPVETFGGVSGFRSPVTAFMLNPDTWLDWLFTV